MNTAISRSSVRFLFLPLAVVLSWSVSAQNNDLLLEEVIVTSTKRAESIQEVPISIKAFTGEQIESLDMDEIMDLYVRTPNMAFSRAGGEAQIYLRGIGTNIFGVGVDPSVAVHQDGVYLARTHMALGQFLDVDRIEILRGPQGTLYGRNTTGGAINIISRGPTEETEGYVSALAGSFSRKEVTAAVGGPISDTVGYRLAARWAEDDGYTDDLDPAGTNEIDDNDITSVRGTVAFTPSDRFDFTLIADWSDFDSGNRTIRPLDNLGAAQALGSLPLGAFDETRNNLNTFHVWETSGVTAILNWQLSDNVELSSITGYRDYESDFLFNTDGTEIDITRSNFKYESDQLTQELRLASTGDGRLQWITGVYYLSEDKFGALGLIRAGGRPLFAGVPGSTGSFIIPEDNEGQAWAVFGEVSYDVTDAFRVIAGLRYSSEEKDDVTNVGAVFDLLGLESPSAPTFFGPPRIASDDWDDVTPKLGLEYDVTENILLYGSLSQGFKSGGYNAFDRNPSFEPEEVTSFEIGFKSDSDDGTVRLNGAFFYYDYQDLQVSTFINGLTLTTNAAEATLFGGEMELAVRPNEALEFSMEVSLLDATYDEFTDRQGNNPDGSPRVLNLAGNTLPNAPKFKASVGATYTLALANGNAVEFFAQASHQGDVFFTQFNESVVGQNAFNIVDARISWLLGDGRWSLSAFGKNLGDEEYFHNVVRFTSTSDAVADPLGIGNALGYTAPGRSVGVQVSYSF